MIFKRLQTLERGDFSPLHRVVRLRDELDNLFAQAFRQPVTASFGSDSNNSPALDLYEEKDQVLAKVELPGMKKEDITVALDGDVLTVSGERKEEAKPDTTTFCRCERALGRFERQINLPFPVDEAKIKATYLDGVLTVTLPKAEAAKLKQIPIDIK